jgi:hypothetical protein
LRPFFRPKRFRCPLGRRLRMNLKWKPTQISLQLSRRLFGPDRAKITKRSNNIRPDVDDVIHKRGHRNTERSCREYVRREPRRIDGKAREC